MKGFTRFFQPPHFLWAHSGMPGGRRYGQPARIFFIKQVQDPGKNYFCKKVLFPEANPEFQNTRESLRASQNLTCGESQRRPFLCGL
jgi:hypothetical protein